MKKNIALVLIGTLCVPIMVYAQETEIVQPTATEITVTEPPTIIDTTAESAPAAQTEPITEADPITESAIVPAESHADTQVATAEQITETVQETATSTQETTVAEILEGTANPEAGVTESAAIPVLDATSTAETVTEPIELVETTELAPTEIPVAAVSDLTVVEAGIKEEAIELTNAELNAMIEPDFVMSLSGRTVPTILKAGDTEEAVTASVDPEKRIINVAGSCSDAYYVVLLYKNVADYDTDPASYILNRAYPCVNGAYDYAIDNLPASVQNGTYYLLIGEQGERGSWRPASSLTEISINRSN